MSLVLPGQVTFQVLLLHDTREENPDERPFWPSIIAKGPTVACTVSIVLMAAASVSVLMLCTTDHSAMRAHVKPWNARRIIVLAVAGVAGGVLSGLSATGGAHHHQAHSRDPAMIVSRA